MVARRARGRRGATWYQLLIVLAGAALAAGAAAGGPPLAAAEVDRVRFLRAEHFVATGQWPRFERLAEQLRDHPLLPYLRFEAAAARIDTLDEAAYARAQRAVAATPLAARLHRIRLRHLARTAQWARYAAAYREDGSVELACFHLQALIALGRLDAATAAGRALWLSPRSRPPACDPPFRHLLASGRLGPEEVWQRAALAMDAGASGLARYLRRFLEGGRRRHVDAWLALGRSPSRLVDYAASEGSVEPVLLAGLHRLARRDPDRAVEAWGQVRAASAISPTVAARAAGTLGLALVAHRRYESALPWLLAVPEAASDDALREARIVSAIAAEQWPLVLALIAGLPPESRRAERWRYWRGRAHAAAGDEQAAAREWERLAAERSYYGFLAADRLGLPYRLNQRPLRFAPEQLRAFAGHPGFVRARELRTLGRQRDFRREWWHLMSAPDTDLKLAARAAHAQGWHGAAIQALARSRWLDDLEVRFPAPFREAVLEAAATRSLDPGWVYATIRQESAFMVDARSPKGALGLMQLMPRTGRQMAQRLNVPLSSSRGLLDATTNVHLGTAYLRRVLDQLGHPVLASAAYNAGPGRVRRWLPDGPVSADLWIETVPYRETRRYVQRVLTYAVIYERLLGDGDTRLSTRLYPIGDES